MLIRSLFTLLFLTTFLFNSYSQTDCSFTLKGIVQDDESRSFLSYGHVHISETKTLTVTNESGEFTVEELCAGKLTVCFHHLGYEEECITVNLQSDTVININPKKSAEQIEEIDIEIIQHEKEEPHLVVEKKEMIQNIGKPIGESIAQISGVTELNTGNGVSKPVIHGMHSNRVLIINDQVRLEGQQWGGEHAPEIDPFTIEELQVIKGASSVLYGSDAIAGVVILKPLALPDTIGVSGNVQMMGQSNGRGGAASMMIQGKTARYIPLSYRVQGSFNKTGNLQTPDYYLGNTGIEGMNFSSRIANKSSKHMIEAYYKQFNSRMGIFQGAHIGNLTDLQYVIDNGADYSSTQFSYLIDAPFQNIYHQTMGVNSHLYVLDNSKLKVNYAKQTNIRQEFDAHGSGGVSADLNLKITTQTADVRLESSPSNNWSSVIGAQYINQKNIYRGRYFIPNFLSHAAGVFTYQRFKINTWLFEAGGRFDMKIMDTYRRDFYGEVVHDVLKFNNVSYNLGVEKNINENIKIAFNSGYAWRPPSIAELYADGIHHGAASYEMGDLELDEEQVLNLNAIFHFNKEHFDAEINFYYNHFKSFIYLKPNENPVLTIKGAFPAFTYTQTPASIKGVDMFFRYESEGGLYASNKTAFLWALNENDKSYIVGIPGNITNNTLGYEKDIKENNSLYIEFESEIHFQQNRTILELEFMAPPETYHLINAKIGWTKTMNKKELFMTLGVSNLLNTEYRDYLNRLRFYSNDLGRNIIITTRLNF